MGVVFVLIPRPPPRSTLFPYTTLFRSTEQLSSMEMMGVDPLRRVIAPRLWAGFIAMPVLAIIFSVVGIWGGMLVDRKSTRLNSSHVRISYAVFCLKKKKFRC